ncbi:MAG: hypothetical protein ACE5KM_14320 [Planctomycetaceae bacterium]
MKSCPYCAEPIQNNVRRCPHCGEMIGGAPQRGRRSVVGPPCPKCGGRELKSGPWPWYLGTVGAMIVKAVICVQCGHHFDAKKPDADLTTRKRNLAILLNGIGALGIVAIIGGLILFIRASMKR